MPTITVQYGVVCYVVESLLLNGGRTKQGHLMTVLDYEGIAVDDRLHWPNFPCIVRPLLREFPLVHWSRSFVQPAPLWWLLDLQHRL